MSAEAATEAVGAVIARWYKAGLLRFNSHDDGSDDLLLRDEIVRSLAAARGEPPEPGPAIDVERLREALTAMWPHHTEGIGSSPPSPGDHSYEVWEPFLPGSPDSVAAALVSALRDKP